MSLPILQILIAVLTLAASVFAWWVKKNADKQKRITDEDAKIEAVTNADSTIIELDRLRNEPPANRP